MNFDAQVVKKDIIDWIRTWFDQNGNGCRAIVGISGGKDSSTVAALCLEALGKNRVLGVLMPNGRQHDIDVARALCTHLGIQHLEINIQDAYQGLLSELKKQLPEISVQTTNNLPARLRMSTLYAVAQSMNGRVANTCNLSEDWVGYSTRYGDSVGDFSPLSNLTVAEVKALGRACSLPDMFVEKVPIDGLCGKTDEENLGFSYAVLDLYIRTGVCDDPDVKARIDRLHRSNLFKLQLMSSFPYNP